MARTRLRGSAIADESIDSSDIKNGSILLEDLSQEVIDYIAAQSSSSIDPFHNYVDKFTEESTTSDIWQQYLLLTSPTVDAGEYRINMSYSYRINGTNSAAEFRWVLNGTDVISMQNTKQRNNDQEILTASDFINKTLPSGTQTIALEYRTVLPNRIDVFIKEAKVEMRRVAL